MQIIIRCLAAWAAAHQPPGSNLGQSLKDAMIVGVARVRPFSYRRPRAISCGRPRAISYGRPRAIIYGRPITYSATELMCFSRLIESSNVNKSKQIPL